MSTMSHEEKDRLFEELGKSIVEFLRKTNAIDDFNDGIIKLLQKKNRDYGDSAYEVYKDFGDLAMYIRLSDKLRRLKSHTDGLEFHIKNEVVDDIYMDIAGYCILALASRKRLESLEGDDII